MKHVYIYDVDKQIKMKNVMIYLILKEVPIYSPQYVYSYVFTHDL